MTYVYIDIILKFDDLDDMHQHKNKDGKLYLMKDFDQNACGKLYDNFNKGLVNEYLTKEKNFKYIIQNLRFLHEGDNVPLCEEFDSFTQNFDI